MENEKTDRKKMVGFALICILMIVVTANVAQQAYINDDIPKDTPKEHDRSGLLKSNGNVTVWTDGNSIWIDDYDEAKVYRYDMDGVYRDSWDMW